MRAPRLSLLVSALLVLGCAEKSGPARVATVEVSAPNVELLVGPGGPQSIQLSVAVRDDKGAILEGRAVTWSTTSPLIIAISSSGLVTALRVGVGTARATVEGRTGDLALTVTLVPVAQLDVSPGDLEFALSPLGGTPRQLTALLRDSAGTALFNRPVTWATTNPTVATVSSAGLVTPTGGGSAFVRASAETRADSVAVTVDETDALPPGFDLAIIGASWTQGSQTADNAIPLIKGGRSAVLNVMTSASHAVSTPTPVILRLLTEGGALYYADTVHAPFPSGATTTSTTTVQFLVAQQQIVAGAQWEVVRGDAGLADDTPANDRFPATQPAPLSIVTVPPLKIRFVPIVLSAHANATGNVSAASIEAYTSVVRALFPHGDIETSIAPPFVSSASFGTAPSGGGGGAFWLAVLPQLDAARVADANFGDWYWVGLVQPPSGYTSTQFGGYGYIPNSGAATGPGTRTSLVVSYPWFGYEPQSRNLVAHEIGHNLGRFHAPCGGAGGPDGNFPNAGGSVGPGGHNTYAWQTGLATRAEPVPPSDGDLMSYCVPVWLSTYMYGGMLAFRGTADLLPRITSPRTDLLLVQGQVDGTDVSVLTPRVLRARPSDDTESGDWTLTAYDAAGAMVATRSFALGRYDHEERIRPFAVTLALSPELAARVRRVEVRGPAAVRRFAVRPY